MGRVFYCPKENAACPSNSRSSSRCSRSSLLAVPAGAEPRAGKEAGGGVLSLLPPNAKTEHSIVVGGRTLSYEADAGTEALIGGDGATIARMFYVAYRLKPPEGGERGGR